MELYCGAAGSFSMSFSTLRRIGFKGLSNLGFNQSSVCSQQLQTPESRASRESLGHYLQQSWAVVRSSNQIGTGPLLPTNPKEEQEVQPDSSTLAVQSENVLFCWYWKMNAAKHLLPIPRYWPCHWLWGRPLLSLIWQRCCLVAGIWLWLQDWGLPRTQHTLLWVHLNSRLPFYWLTRNRACRDGMGAGIRSLVLPYRLCYHISISLFQSCKVTCLATYKFNAKCLASY